MIPKEFAYAAPASLDEALGLLGQPRDEAKNLAAGRAGPPAPARPAVILALDADLEVAHGDGKTRRIAAADFFTGLLSTAIEPGEILTRIHLPGLKRRSGAAYVKLRNKASHYAL